MNKKMIKITILFLLVFQSIICYSKDTNTIGINTRYPITIGDNYVNEVLGHGYTGRVDINIEYNFINYNKFNAGLTVNYSNLYLDLPNINLNIISPKFRIGYDIYNSNRFRITPSILFGYSFWNFKSIPYEYSPFYSPNNQIGGLSYQYTQKEHALSYSSDIKFNYKQTSNLSIFINISYELVRLPKPDEELFNNSYNRTIQLLYPGIGIIWNI